jgi:hypothetical protein
MPRTDEQPAEPQPKRPKEFASKLSIKDWVPPPDLERDMDEMLDPYLPRNGHASRGPNNLHK